MACTVLPTANSVMTKLSFDSHSAHVFYLNIKFKNNVHITLGLCSQCRSNWNQNIKMLFTEVIDSSGYNFEDLQIMCEGQIESSPECYHVRY